MNISVTNTINAFHSFSKKFWLGYKTLEKLYPNFDDIKMTLLRTKRIDSKYYENLPTYLTEFSLLEKEWSDKSEESKLLGISTHEYIHNLLCTNPVECKKEFLIPTDKYSLCLELASALGIFVELRLEIPLEYEITLIGIPDYFIIHDGIIDIKDWKVLEEAPRFKSMYEVSLKQSKKMKYPLNSLEDSDGVRYLLQLSIYMWMLLQIRPDLKPGTLEIVWVKDKKILRAFPVEYLKKEVTSLMKWYAKDLYIKLEMKKCNELNYE